MARLTIFHDINRTHRSGRFEEEDISTIFGDVRLNLVRKPAEYGEHTMRVLTVFGDVQLRLAEDVGLKIDGFALFGDVEVETLSSDDRASGGADYISENYDTAPVRLNLNVTTIFGDLEIIRLPVGSEGPAQYEGQTTRLPGEVD
ncbi:MAG: hypothetical protein EOM24_25740 [Chloroflexia bacterium]|nr:hypothetical protein [Chloroflexia bacterium]